MFEIIYEDKRNFKSDNYIRPKCSCGGVSPMVFTGDLVKPDDNDYRFGYICPMCKSTAVLIITDILNRKKP